jgi:hypothetical protein
MQVVSLPLNLPTPSIGEWTTSWARMPSSTKPTKTTKLQEVHFKFPSKIIYEKEIFQDISKQMLETNYILNLGWLIKKNTRFEKILMAKTEG